MSASGAGGDRIRDLFRRAAEAGSLGAIVFRGIGAVLLAVGTAFASGVLTVADLVIQPAQATIDGVTGLIGSIFGGAELVIDLSALTTAVSLGPSGRFALGPFTLALGVGAILLALFAMNAYLSDDTTGNFAVGLPFDIPTPGFQGPEEDDEGG